MKNNFHKKDRKAFTIVELVIVIAVIAILAAVLIPTFANIIKKSNLSADKQAVREMNQALAEYEASSGYTAIADVDSVMRVLANAGYNTDNWKCLTQGYEVYWYKNDNRMILYNAKEAKIEFPEEYIGTKTMVSAENGFFVYNYNHVQAQNFDISLSSEKNSEGKYTGSTNFSSVVASVPSGLNSNQSKNIETISSAVTNSAVQTAIASTEGRTSAGTIYMYASREIVSSDSANAYASLQVAAVGSEENPVKLKSDGTLKENLYCLSIVVEEGATEEQIALAQAAAGQYIYNIFDQITTGKIDPGATIIIAEDTVLDCSECEWAPCRTFCGYFGTSNASKPVVIDGARLTAATGFASTVSFTGSGSKYFVTGVFGTLYGNATLENVTFRNINIESPANDYELTESDRNNKKINTRNSVGMIGGITDGYESGKNEGTVANVTLRNIKVESSCSVTGAGCAGGLVGYIGSANSKGVLTGTINIENCEVHADVNSTDSHSDSGYKSVGGILGFTCRVNANTKLYIKNCTYDAKATGFGNTGAVAGAFQNKPTVEIDGGQYASATLSGTVGRGSIAGYTESGTTTITVKNSPSLIADLPHSHNGAGGANLNY